MKVNSLNLIKYSISIVYIWFGLLKILNLSPLYPLIKATYPMFPEPIFLISLGVGEVIIGLLLLNRKTLKLGLILMWFQMGGIFFGVVLSPSNYFQNLNPLILSSNGEFVVKNLVLLAASYSLWETVKSSKVT